MTDKELAEEYANGYATPDVEPTLRMHLYECSKESFLTGLEKGKPKWHTDPNDLPPMIQDERHISERVWINVKNWGTEDGHYDYNKNCWIIRCRIVNLPILGWIEIPKWEV